MKVWLSQHRPQATEDEAAMEDQPALGECLRHIRRRNGWKLKDVSALTGVSMATLSKVENDQMSLTYDKILQICAGLNVHITELLSESSKTAEKSRRSVSAPSNTLRQFTRNYDYYYLATDLVRKRMVPIRGVAKSKTMEDFGPMLRHNGEEVLIVLSGELEVHTELYSPVRLQPGESVYIDSTMGHAYLSVGSENAEFLCVCSGDEPELEKELIGLLDLK